MSTPMPMRLIPTREFALYQLDRAGAQVAAACAEPFDPVRHSGYKYGSTAAADWFGRRLAAAFLARYPHTLAQPSVLIASSPYHRMPTAAAALARAFRAAFNAERTAAGGAGLTAAPLVQIERTSAAAGDYDLLSPESREQSAAAAGLSFGGLSHFDLRGAHLIVVDDLKATGAQQRALVRASRALPLGSRTFLYTAALDPVSRAGFEPGTEDRLDHARIRTLRDLAGLLRERVGDFAWNARTCTFLLAPQNRDALPEFLGRMPSRFVRELYCHSLNDGYALMNAYRRSHGLIALELHSRGLLATDDVPVVATASSRLLAA